MDQQNKTLTAPATPSIVPEKSPPSYFYRHTWRPGRLLRAPKVALASLVGIIVCCIASVCLVILTDNRNATYSINWILGALGSIATFLMLVVLANGVTINWWLTALKGGPVRRLHYIWDYGGNATAWFSCSHVNLVAVATVLTTISGIAYAPILLRSSRIENQQTFSNGTMLMDLLPMIPDGYGGTVNYNFLGNLSLNLYGTSFLSDIQEYYNGSTLGTPNQTGYLCDNYCQATVPVAGLAASCDSHQEPLNLETAAANHTHIFDIDFSRYNDPFGYPTLELAVVYASEIDEYCNGVLNTVTCQLRASLVNYPITIQNGTIDINSQRYNVSPSGTPYSSPGDAANAPEGTSAGPLTSLAFLGLEYYKSSATVSYSSAANFFSVTYNGRGSFDYFDTNSSDYLPSRCQFQWMDPHQDIIAIFQSVMFWNAYGSEVNPPISFTALQEGQTLVYKSEYAFLAIATVLIILSLFSVATLLWGWWDLGRPVSLSPLEIAKAFGAPMLADAPDDAKGIIQSVGERSYKYGEVGDDEHGGTKLTFGAMGNENEPRWPTTTETINHA
jgi:hypothetical protein